MSKMPAIVYEEVKNPQSLRLQDVKVPEPAPGEVLVEIAACALNRRDHWILNGMYPGIKVPCILGSDGAGTVAGVGENVSTDMLGQQVVINPAIDWGAGSRVQGGGFRILGMPDDGTQAGFVAVPEQNVHRFPTHLTMIEAAAIPLGGLTAYRALFTQGKLASGQTVLLTGIGGGVATLLLLMAVAAGARVLVTSGSERKIDAAIQSGATLGANYRSADWAKQIAGGAGAAGIDLIVDSAGGRGFDTLTDLVKPGGKIVFFGATAGNPEQVNLRKLFWKQITLQGSTMGSPDDFGEMLDFFNTHSLRPIIDGPYQFADYQTAYKRLAENSQFGKIVISGPDRS